MTTLSWTAAPAARPSALAQWWALTRRIVRTMARAELFVAMVTPLIFTLGFYLPLRYTMQHTGQLGMSYAQYVMPIVALQTMSFTMMSNAQLAAFEALTGLSTRLQSMPVASFAPLAARISAGLVRSVVALAATIGFGYLIGFRFHSGIGQSALFCVFTLAVGTTLSVGADMLGNLSRSPEALSQALTLPILIFGLLSCGLTPVERFPSWIRPFVRDQPVSQFALAMRDMTVGGGVSWHVLWVPLAWLVGLAAVFVPAALWASGRRS
jgi:ABC-2 type transport system permease protein